MPNESAGSLNCNFVLNATLGMYNHISVDSLRYQGVLRCILRNEESFAYLNGQDGQIRTYV